MATGFRSWLSATKKIPLCSWNMLPLSVIECPSLLLFITRGWINTQFTLLNTLITLYTLSWNSWFVSVSQWELSFHLFFLQKYFCTSNCCHLCLCSWISAVDFKVGDSERVSSQRWPLHFYIINFSCFTADICIAPGSKDFHWAMNKSSSVLFMEEPQLLQIHAWETW